MQEWLPSSYNNVQQATMVELGIMMRYLELPSKKKHANP